VTRTLSGRWVSVTELSEILRVPSSMVYRELCRLARTNGSYVLLLRDGSNEPCVLMLPVKEWENILHYISLLPRAA